MRIAPPSTTVYTVTVPCDPTDRRVATTAVRAGLAFSGLALYLRFRPEPAAWERRVSAWAVHLDGLFGWAWGLGSVGVVALGLLAALIIGIARRRPLAVALSLVAVPSLVLVQAAVKPLVGREAGLVYGFPSGHAVSSGFLAVALVAALWLPAGRGRVVLVATAGVAAASCGAAAVSGRSHLPTDVLGSWLWLLSWSAATAWWVRRLRHPRGVTTVRDVEGLERHAARSPEVGRSGRCGWEFWRVASVVASLKRRC